MRFPSLPLLFLAAAIAPQAAMAFNCTGITFPSSIVICSDPDLTRLADERQQTFNETRSWLTPDQQSALWEDQKAWVRSYATACGVLPDSTPPIPAPPSMIECFRRGAEARTAYLRTYGSSGEVPTAPAIQSASASIEKGPDVDEVALVQTGGVFEIPVRINGTITLNFILDSGASDVQLPFDVFSTLVRANTIKETDLIGESTYVLADGSKKKAPKFLIRELKIGNQILHNVPGSVGPANGSLLLGQSFLSHFDSWTFDNKRHVLRLAGRASESSGENAATPSDNNQPGPIASLAAPPLSRTNELSTQSAVVCGRALEYTAMREGGDSGFLGVWTGNWNSTRRLCGALIVQEIDPRGTANVIYVYGGGGLPWKQQHRRAVLNNNVLSFQDDQGSTFRFRLGVPGELEASFFGQSGRLSGTFQKSN